MTPRSVVIVFAGFVAIACASASVNAQAAGAEPGGARGEGDPVRTNVIAAAPSTFKVALEDEVRQRLELYLTRGSLGVARLVVRGLRPRSAQALKGVRVFVEKPDADAGTSVDDPHYAGNFVLGLAASQSMLWNIAPTLSRLWRSGDLTPKSLAEKKVLQITFVPERWDFATALPEGFALPFESLTLEVPPQP
jgi:hypothetical protein